MESEMINFEYYTVFMIHTVKRNPYLELFYKYHFKRKTTHYPICFLKYSFKTTYCLTNETTYS